MAVRDYILADDFDNFLHDALDHVEQHSTVEEFFHQFDATRELVSLAQPWLTEAYFASRFVYGLRTDIQGYVLKFCPSTVLDAFHLACIYEYNFSLAYIVDRDVDIVCVGSPGMGESMLSVIDTIDALHCDPRLALITESGKMVSEITVKVDDVIVEQSDVVIDSGTLSDVETQANPLHSVIVPMGLAVVSIVADNGVGIVGSQAIAPILEISFEDDLCSDRVCIPHGQFDVGLTEGQASILDKGGTVVMFSLVSDFSTVLCSKFSLPNDHWKHSHCHRVSPEVVNGVLASSGLPIDDTMSYDTRAVCEAAATLGFLCVQSFHDTIVSVHQTNLTLWVPPFTTLPGTSSVAEDISVSSDIVVVSAVDDIGIEGNSSAVNHIFYGSSSGANSTHVLAPGIGNEHYAVELSADPMATDNSAVVMSLVDVPLKALIRDYILSAETDIIVVTIFAQPSYVFPGFAPVHFCANELRFSADNVAITYAIQFGCTTIVRAKGGQCVIDAASDVVASIVIIGSVFTATQLSFQVPLQHIILLVSQVLGCHGLNHSVLGVSCSNDCKLPITEVNVSEVVITILDNVMPLFLARTGSSNCHNDDGFHAILCVSNYQLSILSNFLAKEEDKGGTAVHPLALMDYSILIVLSKIQSPDQDPIKDKRGLEMLITAHFVKTVDALSTTDWRYSNNTRLFCYSQGIPWCWPCPYWWHFDFRVLIQEGKQFSKDCRYYKLMGVLTLPCYALSSFLWSSPITLAQLLFAIQAANGDYVQASVLLHPYVPLVLPWLSFYAFLAFGNYMFSSLKLKGVSAHSSNVILMVFLSRAYDGWLAQVAAVATVLNSMHRAMVAIKLRNFLGQYDMCDASTTFFNASGHSRLHHNLSVMVLGVLEGDIQCTDVVLTTVHFVSSVPNLLTAPCSPFMSGCCISDALNLAHNWNFHLQKSSSLVVWNACLGVTIMAIRCIFCFDPGIHFIVSGDHIITIGVPLLYMAFMYKAPPPWITRLGGYTGITKLLLLLVLVEFIGQLYTPWFFTGSRCYANGGSVQLPIRRCADQSSHYIAAVAASLFNQSVAFQLDTLMQQIFCWLCLCNRMPYDYLGDSRLQQLRHDVMSYGYHQYVHLGQYSTKVQQSVYSHIEPHSKHSCFATTLMHISYLDPSIYRFTPEIAPWV